MSFFSSLVLFYPGRPPGPTISQLRKFCEEIRAAFAERDWLLTVELQYGMDDNAAFDATHEVRWDTSETIGRIPLEEDRKPETWHHELRQRPWAELWPHANDDKTIHRAYTSLGSLRKDANRDLTAFRDDKSRSYIVPDMVGVSINPACAMTLGTEGPEDEDICYGFLNLRFSGNGYFTWQPLDAYWQAVRQTATMQQALQLCREAFPVPESLELGPLSEALGDRFLNRNEYQPGNWVVSVSETG